MRCHVSVVLLGLTAALAGCQATGGGSDVVDPQLVQFCRQNGYAPGTQGHQWCLERYSLDGRGRQLDTRSLGRGGGGP